MKMRLVIILVLSLALGMAGACGGGGGTGGNSLSKDDIIIMLGNSITHGGSWAAWFPNNTILNFGQDGDTTDGMLSRLSTALAKKPKVLCVMGGINDLIRRTPVSQVYSNLRQIVLRCKAAGVIVIVQSTLYTGAGYPNSSTINPNVVQLNDLLSALASAEGERWLNLNSSMATNNYLRVEYLQKDNLHLNSDGYAVWVDRLNNALP